jgi:hypothetical protein
MKTVFFLVMLFITQSCKSQSQKCECDGFLIPEKKAISLYNNSNSQKVVYHIKNDSINEIYYNLLILESNKNLLKVIPTSISDTVKKAGWIKNDNVGIYSATYNRVLHLYAKPDKKSDTLFEIKEYFTQPLTVISCSGKWLFVEVKLKDKFYKGWMASEDQCANVYSTCN